MIRCFYLIPALASKFGTCIYEVNGEIIECSFFETCIETSIQDKSNDYGFLQSRNALEPLKLCRFKKPPKQK